MKARVYMRVARYAGGRKADYKVSADVVPKHEPLRSGTGDVALPTAAFALDLDIPDGLFDRAEQVLAEITVPEDAAVVAAEVHYPEAA